MMMTKQSILVARKMAPTTKKTALYQVDYVRPKKLIISMMRQWHSRNLRHNSWWPLKDLSRCMTIKVKRLQTWIGQKARNPSKTNLWFMKGTTKRNPNSSLCIIWSLPWNYQKSSTSMQSIMYSNNIIFMEPTMILILQNGKSLILDFCTTRMWSTPHINMQNSNFKMHWQIHVQNEQFEFKLLWPGSKTQMVDWKYQLMRSSFPETNPDTQSIP